MRECAAREKSRCSAQDTTGTNRSRRVHEIQKYQQSTELLIRKTTIMRLIREIMATMGTGMVDRVTKTAVECLQDAAEAYITGVFKDKNLCAIHAKRMTISCHANITCPAARAVILSSCERHRLY